MGRWSLKAWVLRWLKGFVGLLLPKKDKDDDGPSPDVYPLY